MPICSEIIAVLESLAPRYYQESYDNSGLLTGSPSAEVTGILCTLDVTEKVVEEAIQHQCNLIIAHHPLIFGGIKHLRPDNYVSKTLIHAIKNDIAIYAIHTNLDNILNGVSGKMASVIGLQNVKILSGKKNTLAKLQTFVPVSHAEAVRTALFSAGAGGIGKYDECSFNTTGTGSFRGLEGTNPYVGESGKRHYEEEIKIEVVFPFPLQNQLLKALKASHPYEEVAVDILPLLNEHPGIGSGVIGELPVAMGKNEFLAMIADKFKAQGIRYTNGPETIKKLAVCGGAGSFLIPTALAAGADAYLTADVKYHEFFESQEKLMICDIGHFESEQFTIDLLNDYLVKKFPNFAILKSGVLTNPIKYFGNISN